MSEQTRVLFGITTKAHSEIGLDEMYGLQELGYACDQFEYGGKQDVNSAIGRLYVIFSNAIKLLVQTYKFNPNFIYINSRVEHIASARDFITIMLIKVFYLRKVHFLIKSHGSNLEVLETENFFYKKMVFPALKRNVRAWLFLSTEELRWIVSRNLLKKNTLYLTKNIVRSDKFKTDSRFRSKQNIPEDHTILLFVGRIIKEKGLDYVIDAFAAIKDKHKVYLIIVGDGEDLITIKDKIAQLNIGKEILVTGWINEAEVAYYTSNSDVLIYPTFAPEGLPMALFNSLAAGLSVITTQTRAAFDYLEEPNNCLWVQPRSALSIAEALEKLLSNADLMEQMQINNKQKARLFTKSFVSHELSAILNSIRNNEYNESFREVRK